MNENHKLGFFYLYNYIENCFSNTSVLSFINKIYDVISGALLSYGFYISL